MLSPRQIVVTTTSSLDGMVITQYIRPVSAHVVTGTNIFSDFLASITDVFGGRSQTYQKQLSSIYNEAIEKLKSIAFEIGGNCIVGLKIDLDEISGKGKSMFMITAIGTAVIVSQEKRLNISQSSQERFENISIDEIRTLQKRRSVIKEAAEGKLTFSEEVWSFITDNQVHEMYPYIIERLAKLNGSSQDELDKYRKEYKKALNYVNALPEGIKVDLLYNSISTETNNRLFLKIAEFISDLHLLNLDRVIDIGNLDDFEKSKRVTRIIGYEKNFYSLEDIGKLKVISQLIATRFKERGRRLMKKQLLSSKEKEVWTCDCGKTNDVDTYCKGCKKDIYGFTLNETSPLEALSAIAEKIDLISESIDQRMYTAT